MRGAFARHIRTQAAWARASRARHVAGVAFLRRSSFGWKSYIHGTKIPTHTNEIKERRKKKTEEKVENIENYPQKEPR